MADRAEAVIALTDAPDDSARAVITDGLRAYNEAWGGTWDARPLAFLHQFAGDVVDRGNMVGIDRMPEAETVGEQCRRQQ